MEEIIDSVRIKLLSRYVDEHICFQCLAEENDQYAIIWVDIVDDWIVKCWPSGCLAARMVKCDGCDETKYTCGNHPDYLRNALCPKCFDEEMAELLGEYGCPDCRDIGISELDTYWCEVCNYYYCKPHCVHCKECNLTVCSHCHNEGKGCAEEHL